MSRAQWQQRVEEWRASRLTAEVFAARRGFKASTLRWWSSVLGRADGGAGGAGFVEVVPIETAKAEPAPLEVVVASGRVVRVRRGFDRTLLRDLIEALEAE